MIRIPSLFTVIANETQCSEAIPLSQGDCSVVPPRNDVKGLVSLSNIVSPNDEIGLVLRKKFKQVETLKYLILFILSVICWTGASAQTFTIQDGDTINVTLSNGKKAGFWRYYWPNGDLKYEVYYEKGEKEGLEIKYYDAQDCIEFSNTYINGALEGPSITFFPNCNPRCEEIYKDGLKQGYERCYDENGFIQTEGNFDKGELVGAYAHFDKKGYVTYESPTKETTLKFDKFISGEYKIRDSTIFRVFRRNANWKKVLMVVDMTGSMFPYVGQLMLWYKLNYDSEKIKYYTLFNDGDNLTDDKKPVGNTGGGAFI